MDALQARVDFDQVFARHHVAIQNYCLRRLSVDEANDATAEVFLVAWRRTDETPPGKELQWLYGIARNVVRNARRSRQRRGGLMTRLGGLGDAARPSPETQVVRQFEHDAVLRALETLKPEDQEVLTLRTWEELPTEDIAQVMGLSEAAVNMRLSRARKRLAAAFSAQQRSANGGSRA